MLPGLFQYKHIKVPGTTKIHAKLYTEVVAADCSQNTLRKMWKSNDLEREQYKMLSD